MKERCFEVCEFASEVIKPCSARLGAVNAASGRSIFTGPQGTKQGLERKLSRPGLLGGRAADGGLGAGLKIP